MLNMDMPPLVDEISAGEDRNYSDSLADELDRQPDALIPDLERRLFKRLKRHRHFYRPGRLSGRVPINWLRLE
ncbi:hypothetical protein HJA82_09370 [Rhizobium bangladeshense]|uniref:hypothetical protein n=2 Tax=Rhizobium/Agrobacterium group TaxID=227290 RepID=UPI001C828D92|nr:MULTISPECIES: hypothetical protein [Rhizobium]MBX5215346.1 hypothetical protein [Rhizobium sp. NLR9a]MBX5257022.1 hypothetical protein [Rhizobium sp. NLR16b]MBX4907585.1 hypothetical protein [Rhizobium bangladeshense]MBX5232512.1 hypothetical protein [Rhizobium sp. NLR4a]MBX5245144.1 hypothetical protein [Rhizobium sp. NLR3b]